jgi:hypothetical protein
MGICIFSNSESFMSVNDSIFSFPFIYFKTVINHNKYMKRKKSPIQTISKKPKSLYFSASQVKNYISKDPLLDWLKLYHDPQIPSQSHFSDFLKQRGIDFEKAVLSYLSTKFPITFVSDKITEESCQKAISLITQKVPALCSVPFINHSNKTKGIIDLLVHTDYLNKITDQEFPITVPHYVVIDIKFSTLPLRSDGIHLLNSGNYPFYKSQVYLYTQGIGNIQGYTGRYAYILGRRYKYTSKGDSFSSDKCLDKLGTVDFSGLDMDTERKTKNALSWLEDLHTKGSTWSLSPPSRPELYPNMCIDSSPYKKDIANTLGEITQLWNCGIKHRETAFQNKVKSWRDKKCSSKTLGITGYRSYTIDRIIKVNRDSKFPVLPLKIKNNIFNWRLPENEVFVDFESFSDIFSEMNDIPNQRRTTIIFMIGVYYLENNRYRYKNFTIENISQEEEYRIMNEFMTFIKSRGNPKMWYWHADDSIWEKAEDRQMDLAVQQGDIERGDNIVDNWGKLKWADLCYIFKQEPIVIKHCFKFGLKEVASALLKNGLIKIRMESSCKSGMDASIQAWLSFQNKDKTILKDIAGYNKYDVKVLFEILSYLRKNH